jgi:hypothetical protein
MFSVIQTLELWEQVLIDESAQGVHKATISIPEHMRETQEVERLRLALPATPSSLGRKPPELDQTRLLGKRQLPCVRL